MNDTPAFHFRPDRMPSLLLTRIVSHVRSYGKRRSLIASVLAIAMTACHGLDVSDPTLIRDQDIANASGANARRINASGELSVQMTHLASDVAKITDELQIDRPLGASFDLLDNRDSQGYETNSGTDEGYLGFLDRIFYETTFAIPAIRAYTPDSLKGDFLAQMYAIRGYTILQAAEDICSGFPLNDVTDDNQPLYSGPLTTDSAVAFASAQLDSAIKYVHDSTRFATLARVAKGRSLLDQGKYSEAAAAVASVATTDVYQTESDNNTLSYFMSLDQWSQGGYNIAVGNYEGINGLPFATAHDPRIPTQIAGTSATDSTDTLYVTTKYPDPTTPMVLASGIEARLIEAEAAINAHDGSWLTILNTLRATVGLPDLVDPGTVTAQIDTLYSERAFWLYLTGRRLGDLRRLIKNYGRDPESVFPTGPYVLGGLYRSATAIPFVLAAERKGNPKITTGCAAR